MEKEIIQLQKQWDGILAANGFEDIECRRTGYLSSWKNSAHVQFDNQTASEGRLTYYLALGHYSNLKSLDREVKRVLYLKSEGYSDAHIAKEVGIHRSKVERIIKKFAQKAVSSYLKDEA